MSRPGIHEELRLEREGDRLLAESLGNRPRAAGLDRGGLAVVTMRASEGRFARHLRFRDRGIDPVAPAFAAALLLPEIAAVLDAAGLTVRQRLVVERRIVGATYAEIAAEDGITIQGAVSHASHGAAKVRRAFLASRSFGIADAYREDSERRGRAR